MDQERKVKRVNSTQMKSSQKSAVSASFWNKFFGQKKEREVKPFWDDSIGPAEASRGAPTMFSPGFDTDRDVVTTGYIL